MNNENSVVVVTTKWRCPVNGSNEVNGSAQSQVDGTLAALKALIDGAGLSAEQKASLRALMKPARGERYIKPSGPMTRCKRGDWVKVIYADGSTDRLVVGRSSRRMVKLYTSERAMNMGRKSGLTTEQAKALSARYMLKQRGLTA